MHKDRDSDYGVTLPDLPVCFSAGDTGQDALRNAIDAIECHIEGLLVNGESVPKAKPLEQHREHPDYRAGFWALVDVDVSNLCGKSRRVNITLPERVLTQIDSSASRTGETRSGLLMNAALEYANTHAQEHQ